jgi:hypothetical protein
MAALTAKQSRQEERWKFKEFTLASGNKCFEGGAIFLNPATGKCVSGTNVGGASTYIFLGPAAQDVDATSADKLVNVDFLSELVLTWWDNGAGADAIASTDIGAYAYALDDHTATIVAAAHSHLGKIWAVDAIKGVLIEKKRP